MIPEWSYLVLSYEFGVTLYDCLLQGIHIPKQVMVDVENARQFVRNKEQLNTNIIGWTPQR
jgi:hypothetical protein